MKTELKTTQIGSLPHPHIDSAIEFSFQKESHSIPFLPQLVTRSLNEFLIPQALAGLPGLKVRSGGYCEIDLNQWNSEAFKFNNLLDQKIKTLDSSQFEPTIESMSAWNPFLFELEETSAKSAKIQICGPYTALWALKGLESATKDERAALSSQVLKLLMLRAHAMATAVYGRGVEDLYFFIDEPGLFSIHSHEQAIGLGDIGLLLQFLKTSFSKIKTGVHCCNQTLWGEVMKLNIDYLSIDAALSLEDLLKNNKTELDVFFKSGHALSLGVVWSKEEKVYEFSPDRLVTLLPKEYKRCLYTPACGLGLVSLSAAAAVQRQLNQYLSTLMKRESL